jgi:nucleotide-binding universal stress UspA family protein
MFKKILVPLIGSKFGSRALIYAVKVARCFNAEIILMQVVEPAETTFGPIEPGWEIPAITMRVMQQDHMQDKKNVSHAKRYLSRKLRNIASDGIKASRFVVVGYAAETIIEFCKKKNVDLVVMTTYSKTDLNRAFIEKVTDKVIRESGKSVLVIQPSRCR